MDHIRGCISLFRLSEPGEYDVHHRQFSFLDPDRTFRVWAIQFADKMTEFSRGPRVSPMVAQVDAAVGDFTRNILGMAGKSKVEFDYSGNRGDRKAEIRRVLKIDVEAAGKLLR